MCWMLEQPPFAGRFNGLVFMFEERGGVLEYYISTGKINGDLGEPGSVWGGVVDGIIAELGSQGS